MLRLVLNGIAKAMQLSLGYAVQDVVGQVHAMVGRWLQWQRGSQRNRTLLSFSAYNNNEVVIIKWS